MYQPGCNKRSLNSRLRFDDGRSGFLSTPNPTATINDDGAPAERAEDLIVLPGGSEGGVLSLVRRYPDLVVVNGKRQRVWPNGKQVHGSSMERDATPGWRTVFAIARTIALHGGGSKSITDRIGISLDDVRAAMPALGANVFHTPIGWETRADPGGKSVSIDSCRALCSADGRWVVRLRSAGASIRAS